MTELRHPLLEDVRVRHGFGTRDARLPDGVVRPTQVHGVVVARASEGVATPAEADAILSNDDLSPVGIVTADCVPILLASQDGCAVAAVHAGWRGLAAGVIEAGVARLQRLAGVGSNLVGVVGPHIGACCYEVDLPVIESLRRRFGDDLDTAARPGRREHWMLDLGRLVDVDLARSGLAAQSRGRIRDACTHCDAARFHSYRRDGERAGRLLHWIRAGAVDGRLG